MKNFKKVINNTNINYPLDKLGNKDEILFLDIETTGLSANTSMIYLIGCSYFKSDNWICEQWFAESEMEEVLILRQFIVFISSFNTLIHFNGNKFDLPFILKRCELYNLDLNFENFNGIDLYKRIFPYRYILKLSNCKQKTIEVFLGISRVDPYQGGELINVYKEYCKSRDDDALKVLLQHNFDDVSDMLSIIQILKYSELFQEKIEVKKVQCNTYKDINNEKKKELLLSLSFPFSLPKPISFHANDCYFSAKDDGGILKVPVYQEEMKYFYESYKDYFYLPEEDMAIHKSVATYVDRSFREQASASTCYTRKFSTYLPQWDYIFEPFFKRDYKSYNLFFELTEDLKTNREAFSMYASHILSMMVKVH